MAWSVRSLGECSCPFSVLLKTLQRILGQALPVYEELQIFMWPPKGEGYSRESLNKQVYLPLARLQRKLCAASEVLH